MGPRDSPFDPRPSPSPAPYLSRATAPRPGSLALRALLVVHPSSLQLPTRPVQDLPVSVSFHILQHNNNYYFIKYNLITVLNLLKLYFINLTSAVSLFISIDSIGDFSDQEDRSAWTKWFKSDCEVEVKNVKCPKVTERLWEFAFIVIVWNSCLCLKIDNYLLKLTFVQIKILTNLVGIILKLKQY